VMMPVSSLIVVLSSATTRAFARRSPRPRPTGAEA
jgi:hypothetical protein